MSRVTVLLGSLVVVASAIVPGSHAQPTILKFEGVVPVVPPMPTIVVRSMNVNGFRQSLDGLNCEHCQFRNGIFTYDGGPFRCIDCRFAGNVRVEFKGAAANASKVVAFVRIKG